MVQFAAAALALATTLYGVAAFGADDPIVLLDFWSPTCGPCMQMKPTVESLIHANYPIRQVDVSRDTELARQHNVTGIPCFVMLVKGREVHRVVGAQSSERLQQLFTFAKDELARQAAVELQNGRGQSRDELAPPASEDSNGWADGGASTSSVPGRASDSNAPAPAPTVNTEAPALPRPLNTKLLSSSVRLTVEEAQARSHGTGTIIDAREGEALLVTCGHLFRESKGQVPVTVEIYETGPQGVRVVERVQGKVVSYDLERDVAFVSIRPTRPVCVAAVAPQRTQIAKGDLAASVGCSNGQGPTVMETRITWLDRYQGPPNIEASGAPVEGRSGGGLFNEKGQLVGVCFAADYEGNRGLYAGLESIHDELDRLGLRDVYAKAAAGTIADNATNGVGAMTEPVVRGQEPPATAPQYPDSAAIPPAATISIAPQNGRGDVPKNLSATEQAALEEILKRATKRSVVCIVQPESPGGEVEVITLEDVSDEFVRALAERQQAAATTTR